VPADASGRSRRIAHVDMDAFFASVEQREGDTLRAQAERVARELRSQGLAAACVTLKLRFADFRTPTRSQSGDPTQDGLELHRRASALLGLERLVLAVRLVGVSASRLSAPGTRQVSLLDPGAERRARLAHVVDRVVDRFGPGALGPASLLAGRERRDRGPG
jgi:DNA polymerase-4